MALVLAVAALVELKESPGTRPVPPFATGRVPVMFAADAVTGNGFADV